MRGWIRGNWFKGMGKDESWQELPRSSGRVKKRGFMKAGSKSKLKKAASTVVFVPSTFKAS